MGCKVWVSCVLGIIVVVKEGKHHFIRRTGGGKSVGWMLISRFIIERSRRFVWWPKTKRKRARRDNQIDRCVLFVSNRLILPILDLFRQKNKNRMTRRNQKGRSIQQRTSLTLFDKDVDERKPKKSAAAAVLLVVNFFSVCQCRFNINKRPDKKDRRLRSTRLFGGLVPFLWTLCVFWAKELFE